MIPSLSQGPRWDWRTKWLCAPIVAAAAVFYALLILEERLPASDSLGMFNTQHLFLNQIFTYGSLPKWNPLQTHGTNLALLIGFDFSVFFPVELLVSWAFRAASTLSLSYITLFLDEMALLLGTLLCCRLLFKRAAVWFFVASAMTGSVLATYSATHSLHSFYLVPLMLYFIFTGLDGASPARLALSLAAIPLSTIGNVPYVVPVLFMFWLLIAGMGLAQRPDGTLRRLVWAIPGQKGPLAASLALLLASAAYFYIHNRVGAADTAFVLGGRDSKGWVEVETFLAYGSQATAWKYLELLSGVSLDYDLPLFCGFLAVPFAALGLLAAREKGSPARLFAAAALLTMLFANGTWAAGAAYYLIPFMETGRHIATANAFLRLWLLFLAGFGLEYFLDHGREKKSLLWFPLAGAALSAAVVAVDYFHGASLYYGVWRKLNIGANPFPEAFSAPAFSRIEGWWLAFLAALIAAIAALWASSWRHQKAALVWLFLAANFASVTAHKFAFGLMASPPSRGSGIWELYRYSPYPYQRSRGFDYFDSERYRTYYPRLYWKAGAPRFPLAENAKLRYPGTFYGGPLSFVQEDLEAICHFDSCRMIHLSARFNKYVLDFQTASRLALSSSALDAAALRYVPGALPRAEQAFPQPPAAALNPNFLRYAGCTHDKLQFFPDATAGEGLVRARLAEEKPFSGLYVALPSRPEALPAAGRRINAYDPRSGKFILSRPARQGQVDRIRYEVLEYQPNRVRVRVTGEPSLNAMLYYSDAWDPTWKAFADGREVPVLRANLGYKAVPISTNSIVEFRVENRTWDLMYLLSFACSAAVVAFLALAAKDIIAS